MKMWYLVGLILLIGIPFWGGWPIVAKASDVQDWVVRAFVVNVVTIILLLPFVWGRMPSGTISSKGFWILVVAGLLNFGGHVLFPQLQTTAGSQISVYMPILIGLFITTATVGGAFFYREAMPPAKVGFTLLIMVGIVGLALSNRTGQQPLP
jgi:drug/metabolite transporter (DMT)-like permease